MQNLRTKKMFVTVPEDLFKQLRKKGLLDDIDNTITELLIERFNIEVEE